MSHDGRETFGFLIAKDDEDLDEIAEALATSGEDEWPDGFVRLRWRFGYGVQHAVGGLEAIDEIVPAKWISWDIESDDTMRFLPAAEVAGLRRKLKKLLASPGDATEAIHQALSLNDDESVEELLRAAKDEDLDPADAETTGARMAHVLLLLRKALRRAAARGSGVVAFYRQEA